ncbi:NAD(P)/FAD-dependent oxidoreductase [Pseudomonas sp. CCI3.2]|uniref:flavin-containing monooxygenase n=1 Tax=unclassified Pseudomonas TaxID=196821 RepID=UPI002AC8BEDB|nr:MULTISPECIES: NAD(P)/FAD-dependent oxidoreductase [unclassified Pseudomonas]MEB0079974.1 NAD(P)/FAD-dependent oxidoreductase [Pseudomonas sp. MH10out]MEB0093991.1 NAD(P)/FAD-dependent oxidoreductase [Pseudomonas sp. CCI4.2]MEB0102432.1 NAD(P)/FAD-dependent oxidoreductase [Pseudomonas sp. CCI3.2]MEB0133095.1 NAD(P)/FAD-dependent oxidoreductase [Pseudomonas sp. CCI2.4]MEB0160276.1 NAD(P)/FAD-dependent oxidoreductase [Pseudomonas sp. AH2 (2023)]
MATPHFDVLIIGAGLSGIGAAYRLQTRCPGKRYAILEGRAESGGTWDLFRYPGMRSDSDMFTLSYPFRPWKGTHAIADGAAILQYLRDTAHAFGIDQHIRFGHQVRSAQWSSEDSQWTVDTVNTGTQETLPYRCNFLYVCSGYYDYAGGYSPEFPGSEGFTGRLIHPQRWPEGLDYAGKQIVVIGSGATAVTLVPALAAKAGHVTLLQRSPSYVASLPNTDPIADFLRRTLPEHAAHRIARWKNILLALGLYQFCRGMPVLARKLLRLGVMSKLPKGFAVDKHFKPRYQPWDQRLCLVPNADLFNALSCGTASMVTDEIDTFTASGIRLKSGRELAADIVVTATGLKLQACGGMRLVMDGQNVELADTFVYKGALLSGIPNFALCVGYTNASWTLRADLSSMYVCRLINHMDKYGFKTAMPVCDDSSVEARPLLNISSGYVLRATNALPKQGSKKPWHLPQNYLKDLVALRYGRVEDGVIRFLSETSRRDLPE